MHLNSTYRIARRLTMAALVWASLSVPASLEATAQDSTPMAAQEATPMATPAAAHDVPLIDANGDAVGLATFSETPDGVTVRLLIEGLTPGEHGWHLHDVGLCERGGAEPFASAGGHWNPTNEPHGGPDDAEHHVGDFGNLTATENGLAEAEITTTDFTLEAGPTSVFDENGTAIIVHEGMDDLVTQPNGNSGPRYACGVVAERTDMAATPDASEAIPSTMATPMAMATPEGTDATPMAMATPEDTVATPMTMATPEDAIATPVTMATPVGPAVTPMAVATLEAISGTPMGIATPEDTAGTPIP